MKLEVVTGWLDKTLDVGAFDDVAQNGLQVGRSDGSVTQVAFAVDASLKTVQRAVTGGAQLLVVHHGLIWGGGLKRLTGSAYNVLVAAAKGDLGIYAAHLPLDANKEVGNNWELARHVGLRKSFPAFSYHGNVIGVVGFLPRGRKVKIGEAEYELPTGRIGICSGGAGGFAEEAKELGCRAYLTGEATWGERIAAENVEMNMVCAGHYETETFGVKALAARMGRELGLATAFIGRSNG